MMTRPHPARVSPIVLTRAGTALAVVVALSACDLGEASPTQSPGVSTSVPVSTQAREEGPSTTGEGWTTPTSQGTAGGSVSAEAIRRDVEAVIPTLEPPDGEQIVQGSVEYFEWAGRCAEALGAVVAVTTSPPAIFGGQGPSNRRDGMVISACLDAASTQPWFVPYPFDGSREARAVEYDLKLHIHQCLEENGYPTVEPPSNEAYIAGDDWNPYEAMGLGAPLYVSPFLDDPPGSSQQLEAQERCGASLAQAYQEQIIEADQP